MSVLCLVKHDEQRPTGLSLQALTFARGLAEQVAAPVAAFLVDEPAPAVLTALAAYGVAEVHAAAPDELKPYAARAWAAAIRQVAARLGATTVVAAGSDRGHDVLAHLAALADLPLATMCVSATASGSGLVLTRLRWAGSLLEDCELSAPLALLGIAPQVISAEPAAQPGAARVVRWRPEVSEHDLREQVATSVTRDPGAVSLSDARVVVGGGRGVGGPEGFSTLEELAALLDGTVGVSRVATSLGWRSHRDQVGQTGTRIAPELYLACGISGAIQHMAGCKSAKRLLAVNTDPDAPIMKAADYAVIGDLHQVLPELIKALRGAASGKPEGPSAIG